MWTIQEPTRGLFQKTKKGARTRDPLPLARKRNIFVTRGALLLRETREFAGGGGGRRGKIL